MTWTGKDWKGAVHMRPANPDLGEGGRGVDETPKPGWREGGGPGKAPGIGEWDGDGDQPRSEPGRW